MSSSQWKNYPIKEIDFLNQACARCGRYATIKISGSENNPRKAYFKCEHCDKFVMWLTEDHLIMTKKLKVWKTSEEDEVSSDKGTSEDILCLKKEFTELAKFMKFYVKLIAFMILALVIIVTLKF